MSQSIDLSPIIRAVNGISDLAGHISRQVEAVDNHVDRVEHQVVTTDASLKQLWDEFRTFVESDRKSKALQLAETRQIKIRQELEQRFGHHAEIRRMATGILQASDLEIVRQETLRSLTEKVMVTAPGYWLPPALLALAAWFGDQQDLARRAVAEAQRRDDDKASLFFALVCRRAGRHEATAAWLARFLQIQDPAGLDREVLVMVDAMTAGLFGPLAQDQGFAAINGWLDELRRRPGFEEEQRKRWTSALDALSPAVPASDFPLLRKHSATWAAGEKALGQARRHGVGLAHVQGIFSGAVPRDPQLAVAVDAALDRLVTHCDPEEIPLRRDERRYSLIIEEEGDTERATRRLAAEQETHQERTDFAVILTGAAMRPEVVHASLGTQRLAMALSRDWIIGANGDLTAQERMTIPVHFELRADVWSGRTVDGADEKILVADLEAFYQERASRAAANIPNAGVGLQWFLVAVGLAIVFGTMLYTYSEIMENTRNFGYSSSDNILLPAFFILLGLCLAGYQIFAIKGKKAAVTKARDEARNVVKSAGNNARRLLQGLIAEVVEWRRALAATVPEATAFQNFLTQLQSQDHLAVRDGARRTL